MSKSELLPRGRLFDPRMKLEEMQALPLADKVWIAKKRVVEWYNHWDGQVHVSFSGGKDSTGLLHLVRSVYPDVRAVFCDTGLEFPEIRDFVKTVRDVDWVKPAMNFRKVIEKYGYPVVSKEQSRYIHDVRDGNGEATKRLRMTGIKRDGTKSRCRISEKWKYLVKAPFKISDSCCDVMKKRPLFKYEKEHGTMPYIGTMASDSMARRAAFQKNGCNAFGTKHPVSKPLSPWREDDIWAYIKKEGVPYCKIYDMGYERTGCMFCAFGAHMDGSPNRFERMAETHPSQHRFCMDALGMEAVLEYVGVRTGREKSICDMIDELAGANDDKNH